MAHDPGGAYPFPIHGSKEAGASAPDIAQIDYPAHEEPDPVTDNVVVCLKREGNLKEAGVGHG